MSEIIQVSVIIVNYNTSFYLKKCLESIFEHTKGLKYEIIVVDNNSPDRIIENFKNDFPAVNFYLRDVNDGFGAGCNYGAQISKGKYLTFVNPDIIFSNNALKKFYDYMEINNSVGLCSGLLENNSGSLMYSYNYFPDLIWEFKEAFRFRYQNTIQLLLTNTNIINNKEFEIDWALGALLFVRKAAFDSVMGFDETFFLYYEDDDFQLRLKKEGYKIVCLPYVRMKHSGASSIQNPDGHKIYDYHFNKSRMLYLHKHFGFYKRNLIRLFFILSNILRILYLPFNFNQKNKRKYYFRRVVNTLSIYCKKW
jgi:GT2 family glycosyltransferase